MASIKKFYSRSELGMRAPRSVSRNVSPQNGGIAVHYGGAGQGIRSQTAARDRWLAWQRYHMNTHGWADIAYTAGFDNWGNVYAGRGYGVRTAAQGTNAGNQNYLAFVWLGGGNEKPSKAALEALNWLIEDARKNGNAGNAVKPHNFFKSTACPGNYLRTRAAELDGKSTLPAVPDDGAKPEPEPSPSRDYITVGDKGAEVRSWQQDLQKWNSSALPRFGADGDFGAETAEWTVRFYDAVGLSASDRSAPRVGKASRDAMKKALEEAARQPEPSGGWQGKQVRAKTDVNFYSRPGWAPSNPPAGQLRSGQRFGGGIHEHRAVGNGFQYQVSNSNGQRFWITSSDRFVELVDPSSGGSRFSFRHTDVLRRGAKGAAVTEWQQALRRWRSNSLPRWGADGDFGNETYDWTRRFQSAARIRVDGVVGPQTRGAMERVLN